MNDQRFDQVTRLFGRATSRRQLLGGAAGLGGASLLAAGARRAVSAQDEPATPLASPVADGELRVRKNAASLTADEKLNFVDAVLALKKKPSPWVDGLSVYDTFVLWHRDAFGCAVMAAHMGPAFFPWHRQFVLLFEEQLRVIEPTVTIPYWDWTVDNTRDAAVWGDDLMGGDGDPAADYAVTTGPFRKGKWTINIFDYSDQQRVPFLVRQFGAGHLAPNLPTVEQLEVALSIPVYDVAPWNTMLTPASAFATLWRAGRIACPKAAILRTGIIQSVPVPTTSTTGFTSGSPENTSSLTKVDVISIPTALPPLTWWRPQQLMTTLPTCLAQWPRIPRSTIRSSGCTTPTSIAFGTNGCGATDKSICPSPEDRSATTSTIICGPSPTSG
jgi:hypothetical protein